MRHSCATWEASNAPKQPASLFEELVASCQDCTSTQTQNQQQQQQLFFYHHHHRQNDFDDSECVIGSDDDGSFAADDSWIQVEVLREEYLQDYEAAQKLNGAGGGATTVDVKMLHKQEYLQDYEAAQKLNGGTAAKINTACEKTYLLRPRQCPVLPPPSPPPPPFAAEVAAAGEEKIREVKFGTTPDFHEAVLSKMFVEAPRLITVVEREEEEEEEEEYEPCCEIVSVESPTSPGSSSISSSLTEAYNDDNYMSSDEERESDFTRRIRAAQQQRDVEWNAARHACMQGADLLMLEKHSKKKKMFGRKGRVSRPRLSPPRRKNAKRVAFPPDVKAMLDEALVDKLDRPEDWVPRYTSTKPQNMPKLTSLLERTGLTIKQVRQYMHNNARRGRRLLGLAKDEAKEARKLKKAAEKERERLKTQKSIY